MRTYLCVYTIIILVEELHIKNSSESFGRYSGQFGRVRVTKINIFKWLIMIRAIIFAHGASATIFITDQGSPLPRGRTPSCLDNYNMINWYDQAHNKRTSMYT